MTVEYSLIATKHLLKPQIEESYRRLVPIKEKSELSVKPLNVL